MTTNSFHFRRLLLTATLALFSAVAARLDAAPEIVLPNEHPFLKIEDVSIGDSDGEPVLRGTIVRFRHQRLPPGTHLYIEALDEAEQTVSGAIYYIRKTDFNGSEQQRHFLKFIDLSDPKIAKVVVIPRTGAPSSYENDKE